MRGKARDLQDFQTSSRLDRRVRRAKSAADEDVSIKNYDAVLSLVAALIVNHTLNTLGHLRIAHKTRQSTDRDRDGPDELKVADGARRGAARRFERDRPLAA